MTNQTQQAEAARVLQAVAQSAAANAVGAAANVPGFLAAPKPPQRPQQLPDAETVAAIAGAELAEPLARIDAAYAAAENAVRDLTAARPGGETFRHDLELDVADRLAGQPPKRWRVEALVDGDRRRWAQALVLCRAAAAISRVVQVDKPAIATAARRQADKAAAEWGAAATAGWAGRDDKAEAWQHWRAGEEALADYWAALRLWEWAAGAPGREPIAHRITRIPDTEALPPAPLAAGSWLALGLHLEPATWLDVPKGVVWPDEQAEQLALSAFPEDARRFTALKGAGHHGSNR
jgi:hypothetical protein